MKPAIRFLGSAVVVGALGLIAAANPAEAGVCTSTTSCTLTLNTSNTSSNFGSGNFGSVSLSLSGNKVSVTIDLSSSGFYIIDTGFPGAFGFTDSIGGGLTISNWSSSNYSGLDSPPTGGPNPGHFDGFGLFGDVGATTAPGASDITKYVNKLTFDLTSTSLTDVNQLVNLSSIPPGSVAAFWVVDVYKPNCNIPGNTSCTGLIAAVNPSEVPEPASLALFASALLSLGCLSLWRRKGR